MKSYRLNLGVIISAVSIFTLFIFSLVLFIFKIADIGKITSMLTSYGYIIAPTSLMWIATTKYLWHTKFFQAIRESANIPPDLRGRWEGELYNPEGESTQKFAIEIKQTLTALTVFSYSSLGHSVSLLPEITSSANEQAFSLCFLWQGQTHMSTKDFHKRDRFNGYTILKLHEHENPKKLKGFYFTNHKPKQTRGIIELTWVSKEMKQRLE